jgi:ABC-2 type transport system permease protein
VNAVHAQVRADLRRLTRDRTALFFLILLPVLVILVVGATFGGSDHLRLGVVVDREAGALGRELATRLAALPETRTERVSGRESLRRAVQRGELQGGVVIPAGFDSLIRRGGTATLTFVSNPTSEAPVALRAAVESVVGAQANVVAAARVARATTGTPLDGALAAARRAAPAAPQVAVDPVMVGKDSRWGFGQFGQAVVGQLVLFVFITGIVGGAQVAEARRLGITRRTLASPARARHVIAGAVAARATIVGLQAAFLCGIGVAVFGVTFGAPLGAALVVAAFVLASVAAGMCVAAFVRTPEALYAVGPAAGIGLAMLGGAMWPLSDTPRAMQLLGHITPHAWAMDAFDALVGRREGTTAALGDVAVLCAVALILGALAATRLRRTVTA